MTDINTLIQQEGIKLLISDSKDTDNTTKYFFSTFYSSVNPEK